MKSLLLMLSLCLSLQSYPATWHEISLPKIQINHKAMEDSSFTKLQTVFQEALEEGKEAVDVADYLRKNYSSETEALEEVRDAFFSVQSFPKYFSYRPEIRAYWEKSYSDQGLGFSTYQVSFDTLAQFDEEESRKKAWANITKKVEDIAFAIRKKQLPPAKELEEIMAVLAKDAHYLKTEDQSNNNAYACLLEKNSQCTGFAQSVYLLAKSLGYPCRIIHGHYQGKYHTWNLVQLEGKWYHLDLTGDLDPRDGGYTLTYFLRGDEAMADHEFTLTTQKEDYLKGYKENGFLAQNEEDLRLLVQDLFSKPGTYHIALEKEMNLSFLPSLAEELKASAYPYHQLFYEQEAKRLKLRIRNEHEVSKKE